MSYKDKYPIKHVVVLMLENRSFDNVLGWMTRGGKFGDVRVDGLSGTECNPATIGNKTEYYFVNDKAQDVSGDPNHFFSSTTQQIYGCTFDFETYSNVEGYEDDPCISHASLNGTPTMLGFS